MNFSTNKLRNYPKVIYLNSWGSIIRKDPLVCTDNVSLATVSPRSRTKSSNIVGYI
jgi:hypothetical protein